MSLKPELYFLQDDYPLDFNPEKIRRFRSQFLTNGDVEDAMTMIRVIQLKYMDSHGSPQFNTAGENFRSYRELMDEVWDQVFDVRGTVRSINDPFLVFLQQEMDIIASHGQLDVEDNPEPDVYDNGNIYRLFEYMIAEKFSKDDIAYVYRRLRSEYPDQPPVLLKQGEFEKYLAPRLGGTFRIKPMKDLGDMYNDRKSLYKRLKRRFLEGVK